MDPATGFSGLGSWSRRPEQQPETMGAGPSIAGDAHVSRQSFGQRMCNSICGMFVGVVLFIVAITLTGWNEGDYVTRQEVLAKARAAAHPHGCLDKLLPAQSATTSTLLFLQGCALNGLPQRPTVLTLTLRVGLSSTVAHQPWRGWCATLLAPTSRSLGTVRTSYAHWPRARTGGAGQLAAARAPLYVRRPRTSPGAYAVTS